MKRFYQLLSLLLLAALFLPINAAATETAVSGGSNCLVGAGAYIDRDSDTELELWFTVTAFGLMDELGVKTLELQCCSDQETWTTVKIYEAEAYPEMICQNTAGHAANIVYTEADPNCDYRVCITCYAKNQAGSETYRKYISSAF